jgi:hypothetical protein
MNCWGAKHNEAVYIQAKKILNPNLAEAVEGYEHLITLEKTVMWCRETTAEKLLAAIGDGTIFLDPAPKLHATDPSKNKRRSQWRVNDITKAAKTLYSSVNFRTIEGVSRDFTVGLERPKCASVTPLQPDLFVANE